MNIFDNYMNALHERYSPTMQNAGQVCRAQWERLLARLDDIHRAIEYEGEDSLHTPFRGSFQAAGTSRCRTLRTRERLVIETVACDAAAGLVQVTLDGQPLWFGAFANAATLDGINTIVIGPGEVAITGVNAANYYIQAKLIQANAATKPVRSGAGQRLRGVDSRDRPPTAAGEGRHALDADSHLGHSSPTM